MVILISIDIVSFDLKVNCLGILTAELVKHYLPDLINLNNYVLSSSVSQKKVNWKLLNRKPFAKLGLNLSETIIQQLSDGKAGTIEILLFKLRKKIDQEIEIRHKIKSKPIVSSSSPQQSSISLDNITSNIHIDDPKPVLSITNRSFRAKKSVPALSEKWVSRLWYEELNQQCLQYQQQIQILEAKIRRLEQSIQVKDLQFSELSTIIQDYQLIKPNFTNTNKSKKK